jgi:hypothetical protein
MAGAVDLLLATMDVTGVNTSAASVYLPHTSDSHFDPCAGLLGVVMTIAIVATVVVPHLPDAAHLLVVAVADPDLPIAAVAAATEAVTDPLLAEVIRAEAEAGHHPRVIDRPALVPLEIERLDQSNAFN